MAHPPIIIEEQWRNSPLSIARFYGQIRLNDTTYIIVDRHGTDIFTLSEKADKAGRDKTIDPGEPCDLCAREWIPAYRALGRDRILQLVSQGKSLKEVRAIIRQEKTNKH